MNRQPSQNKKPPFDWGEAWALITLLASRVSPPAADIVSIALIVRILVKVSIHAVTARARSHKASSPSMLRLSEDRCGWDEQSNRGCAH